MTNTEYAIAYSEVLEILKYIPIEDYNKIPKTKIKLFETNANNSYSFTYNPDKTLEEQEVSKIAKGIIAILFRDYWATDTQKEKIIAKQNYDRKILEVQKREIYDPNNVFKNNKKDIMDNVEKEQNLALIETKEVKWYKKIFKFLIKVLRK